MADGMWEPTPQKVTLKITGPVKQRKELLKSLRELLEEHDTVVVPRS